MGKPEAAGRASWSVVLVPEGADISEENNRVAFAVELADRPINVLYVDGYPRWEYRYLKNHLVREQSIRSSVTMLSSDKRYIQEGTEVLASLPRTAQEWARFDAIILGDLRPDVFSAEQLRQIKAVVAQRGHGPDVGRRRRRGPRRVARHTARRPHPLQHRAGRRLDRRGRHAGVARTGRHVARARGGPLRRACGWANPPTTAGSPSSAAARCRGRSSAGSNASRFGR